MTTNPFLLGADELTAKPWEPVDRPPLEAHQIPPEGSWDLFLLEASRGAGKTESMARYFASYMRAHPGTRGRIIAPTFGDAVQSCVRGPSGLESIDPSARFMPSAPGGACVRWPNGSEALVLGTSSPRDVDRLRASGGVTLDWFEEMAANPHLADAWDQAQLGRRMGSHPHAIASTTPRPSTAYRRIRELPGVVRRHATLDDNPHLSDDFKAQMHARYDGTRIGRQEIGGELLEDIEGALFKQAWIEDARAVEPAAWLMRTVVGVDPAEGAGGSEQAFVVCALAADHRLYVLESVGMQESVATFARRCIEATARHGAEMVVEKNHGGAWLREVLESEMRHMKVVVPVRMITSSVGKRVRAEPVAALYEQGRVAHVGYHEQLESQLTSFVSTGDPSDRLDACLAAGTVVLTRRGDCLIERVRVGDEVWTRRGWRRVYEAGRTGVDRFVSTVLLDTGGQLTGTAEHPVWVEGRGFCGLDALRFGDRVQLWTHQRKWSSEELSTGATPRPSNVPIGSTTRALTALGQRCTETSGKRSTALSQMGTSFITLTAIPSTTMLGTLPACLSRSTLVRTGRQGAPRRCERGPTTSVLSRQSGTAQKRVAAGTRSTPGFAGWIVRLSNCAARCVTSRSSRVAVEPAIAPLPASKQPIGVRAPTSARLLAPFAAPRSGRANMDRYPKRAHAAVVCSYVERELADVYNLGVEGAPEFVANGVLVHNCVFALQDLALGSYGSAGRGDAVAWSEQTIAGGAVAWT